MVPLSHIKVGVTGWGDHDSLYPRGTAGRDKLQVYSRHFPIVELDASFYAVQPLRNYEKWIQDTPDHFSFVVKPQQIITRHKEATSVGQLKEEIATFLTSIQPLIGSGKLKAALVQLPPRFDCRQKHVSYLRFLKEQMGNIPCALEFRNQTWFSQAYREETLRYMKEDKWIHSIVDQPQAGSGSSPTVLTATDEALTIVRFHGRNFYGWNNTGHENWRKVRFLYRYNQEELTEWAENVRLLEKQPKEVCLLFNNNSGGDAADNAKEMMTLLGINYGVGRTNQLGLF